MPISHRQVRETGEAVFETKSWCPPELSLQLLGEQLQQEVDNWTFLKYCHTHSRQYTLYKSKQCKTQHLRLTRPPLVGKATSPPLLRNWNKLRHGRDLRQRLINSSCLLVVEILLKSATPLQGMNDNTFISGKVVYQSLQPLQVRARRP